MSYSSASDGNGIWEQRRGRFKGTPLEGGRLLSPSYYMHLLSGCSYDPGDIVGTPAFIEAFMRSDDFLQDLEFHLSRVGVEYFPSMNRERLQTKHSADSCIVTMDGELTLCMLLHEMPPIAERMLLDALGEIEALPANERRPEANAYLEKFYQDCDSYDKDSYWEEHSDEE